MTLKLKQVVFNTGLYILIFSAIALAALMALTIKIYAYRRIAPPAQTDQRRPLNIVIFWTVMGLTAAGTWLVLRRMA